MFEQSLKSSPIGGALSWKEIQAGFFGMYFEAGDHQSPSSPPHLTIDDDSGLVVNIRRQLICSRLFMQRNLLEMNLVDADKGTY